MWRERVCKPIFMLMRPRASTRRLSGKWTRLRGEALEHRLVLSVITVTSLNDSGDGSLRWAVGEANRLTDADTIQFDPDIFLPGMSIPLSSGQLSLTDTTGTTTIDGRGASVTIEGNGVSRIFLIGTGVPAEFFNLTITGGHARFNGSDYTTGHGGGIYNVGDLTVSGCILTNNLGDHEGGGIYNDASAHLTVSGSTLSRNSAASGGGIDSRGDLAVSDSNISYNNAATSGGGIDNAPGALTLSRSTISHNTADNGGGIHSTTDLTISQSTISYNSASEYGGGIYVVYGSLAVSESTISYNSATKFGGGIYNVSGGLEFSESTLAYNSAATAGGIGSYVPTHSILHNALVADNYLRNVNPLSPSDLDGTFDAGSSYNLIGDGSGNLDGALGNLLGTSSDPLDPKLGPLQNNGGRTWTHALLAGSPAFNAGDPGFTGGLYDQRGPGFARIVEGRIDIGAFEVQAAAAQLAVLTHNLPALVSEGTLRAGVGRSLAAKLDAALASLDRGNAIAAVHQVKAFIGQVQGLWKAGQLPGAKAQHLTVAAERAIELTTLSADPMPNVARDAVFAEGADTVNGSFDSLRGDHDIEPKATDARDRLLCIDHFFADDELGAKGFELIG